MMYLIFTASLHNQYDVLDQPHREQEYRDAIRKTLSIVPGGIQPLIVENNGKRETFLEEFVFNGHRVPVIYTNNNQNMYKNKGVNEVLDLHAVIRERGISPNDIIIKLTGRYAVQSSRFFHQIMEEQQQQDVWWKEFNVYTKQFEPNECVLGCYAIRAIYLMMLSPHYMGSQLSPEIAFAKYVRSTVPRIRLVQELGVECIFSESRERLLV